MCEKKDNFNIPGQNKKPAVTPQNFKFVAYIVFYIAPHDWHKIKMDNWYDFMK